MLTRSWKFPICGVAVYGDRVIIEALRSRSRFDPPGIDVDVLDYRVSGQVDMTLLGLDEIEGVHLQHSMGSNVRITVFTRRALVRTLTPARFHHALGTLDHILIACRTRNIVLPESDYSGVLDDGDESDESDESDENDESDESDDDEEELDEGGGWGRAREDLETRRRRAITHLRTLALANLTKTREMMREKMNTHH